MMSDSVSIGVCVCVCVWDKELDGSWLWVESSVKAKMP